MGLQEVLNAAQQFNEVVRCREHSPDDCCRPSRDLELQLEELETSFLLTVGTLHTFHLLNSQKPHELEVHANANKYVIGNIGGAQATKIWVRSS